jgi:hypothetical protein
MRQGVVAAVVAGFAFFAPDIDPLVVKALCRAIELGMVSDVVDILRSNAARTDLEADPKALATVCSAASRSAGTLVQKKKDDAQMLGPLLVEVATSASEKSAGKADAHRALGYAHLALGRIEREAKTANLTAEPWTSAAAALEKAWELDAAKGESLAEAADALVEAADLPGVDAADLQGKAAAICSKAIEKHSGEVAPLRSAALLELARARRLLAAKDKAGTEAALERGIALLAAQMKGTSPDVDLATAHNAIVAFVKNNPKEIKKPKVDFVKTALRLTTPLTVDAPLSRLWFQAKEGDWIYQYTTSFEPIRTIAFDTYSWSSEFTLGDGTKVGGDNLKGLATNEYEISLRDYKKLKSKKPASKLKLNPKLDEGWYFEAGGVDFDGDYVLKRSWYFKSKEGHMTTFRVTIYDYMEGAATGPDVEMLLDSIREVQRK